MKFVGDLKKSPNWLVATLVSVAIWSLSTSINRRGMPTTPEKLLDTSSPSTATTADARSKTTPEQLKTEGIAQTIGRRLREQSARLVKYRDSAALEREQQQQQQQQQNNNDSAAHRSLHSASNRGGGGGGYYRRYNGYGGMKGKGGKGKGLKRYYPGTAAKGNKGKGFFGKGKGTTSCHM
jgi:hypothetical protein